MDLDKSISELSGYVPFPDRRVREYGEAGYWRDLTFHDVLDRSGDQYPNRPFAVGPGGQHTYAEVIEDTERIAAYLVGELGLEPLDMVVLQLTNRIEFLELLFACSRIGVIPVMVLPRHREAEVRHVVELTKASAYVTLDSAEFDYVSLVNDVADWSESLRHLIVIDSGDDVPDGWVDYDSLRETDWTVEYGDLVQSIDVDPNAPGLMLLSGGTTGMPKVIPRTHNDFVFQWGKWGDVIGIEPDWTLMPWVPIGHNASLNPIVGAGINQGATIALEPQLKVEPLLDRTVRENVDFFFAVPTQLVDVIDFERIDDYDLSGVKTVLSGGQKVRPRLVYELHDRWDINVANNFGMGEGPLFCTRPDDPLEVQAETIGQPIAPEADDFQIVDDQRANQVARETPGELVGRGPGVFPGYFRNPAENAAHFDSDGWFYTEDIVTLDDHGNYRVFGRLKDTIIRGGENIYAPGVEDELIEHPAIKNVAVIGVPDNRLGERPVACVELEDGAGSLSLEALRDFLDQRGIAVFKRPERLEIMEILPRTEVGKISKAELRAQLDNGDDLPDQH